MTKVVCPGCGSENYQNLSLDDIWKHKNVNIFFVSVSRVHDVLGSTL